MKRQLLSAFALLCASFSAFAVDLYWGGGEADIADGTPLSVDALGLSGTWNSALKNWAADTSGSAYTNWADGAVVHLGVITNKANADIGLAAAVSFPRMVADQHLSLDYNRYFAVSNAGGGSVSIPAGETTTIIAVSADTTRGIRVRPVLTGAGTLRKYGAGAVVVDTTSPDFSGTIDVQEGYLNTGTARFPGVHTAFIGGRNKYAGDVSHGANDFCFGQWVLGANDSATADLVADDLVVTLQGGTFGYTARSKTRETMGALVLNTWGCLGHSNSQPGGVLTFAAEDGGLRRGPLGIGCLQLSDGYKSGEPKTYFRFPNFSPKDTLLPWAVSPDSRFLSVQSASDDYLLPVATTQADADLSTWTGLYDATTCLRVGENAAFAVSGALDGDLALNALSFLNKTASRYDLGGHSLSLASGGLCQRAINYGSTQNITNGWLTTSAPVLHMTTCDTNAGGDLLVTAAVTGRFDVVACGKGSTKGFGGEADNTYEGTTYVMAGPFSAKKKNAVAIPGDLHILFGGAVVLESSSTNQVAPGASIFIEDCGVMRGGGQTYTGEITLNGGHYMIYNYTDRMIHPDSAGLHFNGGWFTHSSSARGAFELETDVDYAASSSMPARFERQSTGAFDLVLKGGNRTFTVADSATLPEGEPEMVVDVVVTSPNGQANGLVKAGDGILALAATNTYAGATTVFGGTLRVMRTQAPEIAVGSAFLDARRVFLETPVARSLAFGQPLTGTRLYRSGNDILEESFSTRVLRSVDDYEIHIANEIRNGGVGRDLTFSAVDRQGTLGKGDATVTGGTLALDAGVVITNAVSVGANGTLAASGATLGDLDLSGTLSADLSDGPANVDGDVLLANANLVFSGDGLPDETPQAVLRSTGIIAGEFGSVPDGVSVLYRANEVLVRRVLPTVILIR